MSKRGYLNGVGLYFGIKRKWFGLEPNFMFRKRIMRKITY